MPSASDIVALHQRLADELKSDDLLGQWARIRDVNEPNWLQRKFQGEVGFELYPTGEPEYGLTDFKQKVAVFPLGELTTGDELKEIVPFTSASTVWVSWFEHWRKLPNEAFALVTAKWVVFWGEPGDDKKVQVVRAEWDQTGFLESTNSPAAQPHWHVDRDLSLADAPPPTKTLEEIGGGSSRRVTIQDVHLAMGGWNNAVATTATAVVIPKNLSNKDRKEEAKKERERERKQRKGIPLDKEELEEVKAAPAKVHTAWQRRCAEDIEDLVEWSIHTLRYIKSQVRHVRERG